MAPRLENLQNEKKQVLKEIQEKVDSNKHLLKEMVQRKKNLIKVESDLIKIK